MSLTLTGITNAGEFYSHHYLNELLERDLKGLLHKWSQVEQPPDKALRALRKTYDDTRARLDRARVDDVERESLTHALHVSVLRALGYPVDEQPPSVVEVEPDVLANVMFQWPPQTHPLLMVVEAPFLKPGSGDEKQSILDATPPKVAGASLVEKDVAFDGDLEDLLHALFTMDHPPRWVLAMAGRQVLLAERSRWPQGRYLLFDMDELMAVGEEASIRAAAALLCRDAVVPQEGTAVHDVLDEESHRHAYGVSEDLKYNLRDAVELLGNAWVQFQREHKKGIYRESGNSLFDDQLARDLTNECLTFLYRLLFIFYSEARGEELGVLPMKSEAYRLGYSLEHLRDLELVPLHGPQARNGTFIHESVRRLFKYIFDGVRRDQRDFAASQDAFEIPALHSALFGPKRKDTRAAKSVHVELLKDVRFPNYVMQKVLRLLSLSRSARNKGVNKGAGRISYARLGINQLGAVYEGLLSYTGFFGLSEYLCGARRGLVGALATAPLNET